MQYNNKNKINCFHNSNTTNINTKGNTYKNSTIYNHTTNSKDKNLIKNIDFFLFDSYENIKKIKEFEGKPNDDTVYLYLQKKEKIVQKKFMINDLYSRYIFFYKNR